MVDWSNVAEQAYLYWQEFLEWFLNIPLYGQILVLIGIAAVLVLTIIVVYYILKGTVYLIYYILKGIYLLLKGIGLLIYKLFEAIYYAISGKPRPVKQEEDQLEQKEPKPQQIKLLKNNLYLINHNAAYCSECGAEFTERMYHQLNERGIAYCVYCGKGFKVNMIELENY